MFKFIIFLIVFLFFFKWFFGTSNPYKFTMIFGKKGSGKTSYMAKLALKYLKKGYKVYSTTEIKGTYYFDPYDIGNYTFEPNSVVLIDEIGLIWNNRDYKNFQRQYMQWFKYQRQYFSHVYAFSQAFDIDKSLRNLTDRIYLIQRIGKFSFLRLVTKKVGISTDRDGNGNLVDTYAYGSLLFTTKIIYLPRYYGLFNSFNPPKLDIIQSQLVSQDDVSIIYSSTKKWFKYTINLLISNFKEFIRAKVKKVHH